LPQPVARLPGLLNACRDFRDVTALYHKPRSRVLTLIYIYLKVTEYVGSVTSIAIDIRALNIEQKDCVAAVEEVARQLLKDQSFRVSANKTLSAA
jgi:hypothetical protein